MTAKTTLRVRVFPCHPVHGAALALGYFQIIASSVGILVIISFFVMSFHVLLTARPDSRRGDEQLQKMVTLLLELLRLVLCLIMAIVLVVGVSKRRPGYVLAYVIFGVIKLTMAIWAVLVFYGFYNMNKASTTILLLYLAYSLLLVMVYFVYRDIRLKKEPKQMSYNILQEKCAIDNKNKEIV